MPTETFINLPEEKRNGFIQEALLEFSQHNFESASINRIIKKLGIARGSVYQYFTDKLDLWLYLKEYAETQKMQYIQSVKRNEFSSFWEYYKALYIRGIDFDLEQSLCSNFLYRIGFKENSEAVKAYIDGWKDKAQLMFSVWVEEEKAKGTISQSISTPIAVHFLVTISMSIADLLQNRYKVDFDENIRQGKSLYAANKTELIAAVSEIILLLEKTLK